MRAHRPPRHAAVLPLFSLALAALTLLTGPLASSSAAADVAPDFKLPDLGGAVVQLSQVNAEHPVLVSFWATWCVPCPEEMKHLQRFYEQYRERGLEILAISIDGTKTLAQVKPFVEGRRFTMPVLLDTNNDVKRSYLVKAVPSVYLLKPGGEVAYHHVGYRPGDETALEAEILKLLPAAETAPAAEATPSTQAAAPPAASGE